MDTFTSDLQENIQLSNSKPSKKLQNNHHHHLVQFFVDLLTASGHQIHNLEHFSVSQISADAATKIVESVKSKAIPFLRCVVLFEHFLTNAKLPDYQLLTSDNKQSTTLTSFLSDGEKCSKLCQHLDISNTFSFLFKDNQTTFMRKLALTWAGHSRISSLLLSSAGVKRSICDDIAVTSKTALEEQSNEQADYLLPLSRTKLSSEYAHLQQPHRLNKLYSLPHEYNRLLCDFAKFSCYGKEAAFKVSSSLNLTFHQHFHCNHNICLVCGHILCNLKSSLKSEKSTSDHLKEHASVCAAGNGIFLNVQNCCIKLFVPGKEGKSKIFLFLFCKLICVILCYRLDHKCTIF